jgi:hypothetical protein
MLTVVLVPVPDIEIFPGILVSVHDPDEGSPFITTDPLGEVHVGAVIAPGTGAEGGEDGGLITTFPDKAEVHPIEFVTLKVYVPEVNPLTVVPVPEPVDVISPGIRVRIHVPDTGSPVSTTLPVATEHPGCVIVPVTGAVGTGGGALTTTEEDARDVQPAELVTVKVWVPAGSPETVKDAPVPLVVVPPGSLVIVQEPEGNPLSKTLPVTTRQVGCVIVPITGA